MAYLDMKAEEYRKTTLLWSTAPDDYGTDDGGIAKWAGIAQGVSEAARDVKRFLLGAD